MDEAPLTRQQLMAGYAHPYRRWIPIAWQHERAHVSVPIAALVALGVFTADAIDGPDPILLTAGLLVAAAVLVRTLWITFNAALIIGNRIRDWEESDHELDAVRRRRPHAADADPELVHAEYAVAVGEHGDLVTYRFKPLAANQEAPSRAQLLTGKPRYAAFDVGASPYDPVDAARAAEQLAEAQERAAALERAAIERAAQGLEDQRNAQEIEWESQTTGAALRGITGQSP
jgi:hypothetical protein